ncbi:MAG: hypothetical protein RR983_17295 [Massilia sp.]|uniref:hypothetical protein n=1 Tax=Massilia sp. TaxID=1882437 RepID=UPI002FCBF451
MKKYKIAQFDKAKFSSTETDWLDTAESLGIPDLDYVKQLEWLSSHMDYEVSGDSFAYGIFEEGIEAAVATVDIVYSKRSRNDGWLKMLQLSLSPKYSPHVVSASPQVLTEVLDIYASAIVGTVQLAGVHPARTVKLYARDQYLTSLLAGVQERLNAQASATTTCRFEGRFLVISSK